jgi:hypothetical protein
VLSDRFLGAIAVFPPQNSEMAALQYLDRRVSCQVLLPIDPLPIDREFAASRSAWPFLRCWCLAVDAGRLPRTANHRP